MSAAAQVSSRSRAATHPSGHVRHTRGQSSVDAGRPGQTRRVSRWDGEPVLQNLRQTLKRLLTKGWGSRVSLEKLALDFYITAVGLSGAFRIRTFSLTHDQTVVLAIELAKIIDTTNLLLILDSVSDQLLVVHTHILMERLEMTDSTVFLQSKDGGLSSCRCEVLHLFEAPFAFFRQVLRSSSAQVVHASDLGWSPLEASCYMDVLTHWLMEHPVIVYRSADDLVRGDDSTSMASLAVHFEGSDAAYDHSLETFHVPNGILRTDDPSLQDAAAVDSLATSKLSLVAIQDCMQSLMFNRLNSNGSILFADVSCEIHATPGAHG